MNLRFGRKAALFTCLLTALLTIGCETMNRNAPRSELGRVKPTPTAYSSARDRMTLTEALGQPVSTLDPIHLSSASEEEVASAMFAGLTRLDAKGQAIGCLAANWDVDHTGKTYTFHLSPQATFQNGTQVTAQDVVFSLTRGLSASDVSPDAALLANLIAGGNGFRSGHADGVSGISAPDDHTVVITLVTPAAFLPKLLALPFCDIVPKDVVEKEGASFGKSPVGAGPFQLVHWDKQHLVLTRTTAARDGGNVDRLDFTMGLSEQQAVTAWEQGKLDLLDPSGFTLSTSTLSHLASAGYGGDVVSSPENVLVYTGMNVQFKPFSDVRVRSAVAAAIDCHAILSAIGGRGLPAATILPPGLGGEVQSPGTAAPDIAKAKALLKEAGYADGFRTTLWTPNDAESVEVAQVVADQLKQIGIAATIKAEPLETLVQDTSRPDQVSMFNMAWAQDYADPDDFLNTFFNSKNVGPYNPTWYIDPQTDAQLAAARAMTDDKKRAAAYAQLDAKILEDVPVVPEYYPLAYALAAPWVHGYHLSASGSTNFAEISIDKHSGAPEQQKRTKLAESFAAMRSDDSRLLRARADVDP